ncbi:MAG TPA: hypothetical protein VFK52_01555 [Nocardioidaceae bacterium]|nr:hypothetical protein [Nocardioidaceae bacterium]
MRAALLAALLLTLALDACTSTTDPAAAPSSDSAPKRSPTPSPTPSGPVTTGPRTGPVPFPLEASIPQLQRAMRTGRITAVELVEFYLARIAAYDDAGPALNALISINESPVTRLRLPGPRPGRPGRSSRAL